MLYTGSDTHLHRLQATAVRVLSQQKGTAQWVRSTSSRAQEEVRKRTKGPAEPCLPGSSAGSVHCALSRQALPGWVAASVPLRPAPTVEDTRGGGRRGHQHPHPFSLHLLAPPRSPADKTPSSAGPRTALPETAAALDQRQGPAPRAVSSGAPRERAQHPLLVTRSTHNYGSQDDCSAQQVNSTFF